MLYSDGWGCTEVFIWCRMSIIDKYKDMGAIAMGKSEAGIVRKGDKLYLMPNK